MCNNARTTILNRYSDIIKLGDWGRVLNILQTIAEKVLSENEFSRYVNKSVADAGRCVGMDGILINGHYFDWKDFNKKSEDIVLAWLDYFTPSQVKRIADYKEEN